MSTGAISSMLGMGVTIQLLDMFTSTSQRISRSAETLSQTVERSAKHANTAWNDMFIGGALVGSGMGIVNMVAGIGKRALESSSQLEIFRNQFHVMIKDYQWAERVFNEAVQFAAKTPFTIPEVVGAAKTLRAFGFEASQIGGELKIAGDWAAMFGERIEKTSEILGRAMTGGYGRALVYMRGRGINDKDIQNMARSQGTYNDLFDASGRTKRGYDGNKMVAAMNAVLSEKYGGEMVKRMSTIPGMMSNLEDQVILMTARMGDKFKPQIKTTLSRLLEEFTGPKVAALGEAIGMGFDVLLRAADKVLIPLEKIVTWLGELSEKHPAYMKWATVIISVAGALVFLTGTWITWVAISKLWKAGGMVEAFEAMRSSVWGFIGGLLPLVIILGIVYAAWKYNVGGMQDMLKKWWNVIKVVFGAVTEGFASIQNGVVTFSTETYDALEKAGVTKWVIDVMAILYRAYVFVRGAALAFWHVAEMVMFFGSALGWILSPIGKVIEWLLRFTGVIADAGDSLEANKWEGWGYVIGWIAGLFLVGTYAIKAWTAAKVIWTAVTATATIIGNLWAFSLLAMEFGLGATLAILPAATTATAAFNAVLALNPITWIVLAIAALIVGIVILIVYWKEITTWFKQTPGWLQAIMVAATPLWFLPMRIYNNWARVKAFMAPLGEFFKGVWEHPLEWLWDKIAALTAFFIRSMVKITQFLPDWMKPGSLNVFDKIDPDRIDGAFVKNMMANSLDAAQQARLNGSGMIGATVAGLTANANGQLVSDAQYRQASTGPVIIKLDSREIARAVTLRQSEEAAHGRTY